MPRSRPEPPIYTFRVRLLGGFLYEPREEEVWREIEIASNQTLSDLGDLIPQAFDFVDPHLWSFFLSGEPWDRATEYALQPSSDLQGEEAPKPASGVRIRDLPLPGKTGEKEFLFLFDYGDEWHFGVRFLGTSENFQRRAAYPRVIA
ncbi:MAG: hypothetical protein JOZ41_07885, partial [Chloroflexi bacterium]|nr:hypothetical protein [Chloroflexota bacterium]